MVPRTLSLVLLLASTRVALAATGAAGLPEDGSATITHDSAVTSGQLTDPAGRNPNALLRFWNWSDARVRGVVDYILPDTQEQRTWRFSLQPRLGDFVHHDHIRLPMSVTYGLSRRFEGELGFDPYFPNPLEDGRGSGAANIRGGLKYRWEPRIDTKVRAATGVRVVHPLSSAPFEFNDGVNRYSIVQTLARPSPWNPNLEGFVNFSYDLITPSTADGEIDDDDPQDDFYQIGAGWLMHRKRLTYGLAVGYAHTTDGVGTSFTTVTPSVIFDVPSRYVFNSPGQWQLGASVEGKRYGAETAFNFKVRVRWNVDFRQVVREWSDARTRSRMQARNDD